MRPALALAALCVLLGATACTSGGGHSAASNTAAASDSAQGDAASIAASFQRRETSWASTIQNKVGTIADYPKQIDAKHNNSAQISAQTTDCDTAKDLLGMASRPPVLDPAPANNSEIYAAAQATAARLPALAAAVHADLDKVVRFCTWLNDFQSGELDANRANAELFDTPLRYSGTADIKGKKHTCPAGASCYTPDQSLWPRIVTLWKAAGDAAAKGPLDIQKNKVPCLIQGWEKVCDLVVQDQLDYQKWAAKYAKAFDDNKNQPLGKAAQAISALNVEFTPDVLVPLSPLKKLYETLAPGHTYNARNSLFGKDIWIAEITDVMAQLKKDAGKLG